MHKRASLFERPWDLFYRSCIEKIITEKSEVLDIGGGLRFDGSRGNRVVPENAWIGKLIKERGTTYKVLDYVDTYSPDIVGDIQDLPLETNSQQGIVCVSILEHVENPFKAAAELYRVMAPGGYCLISVPFLYYYHAEKGYYGDYWRFTEDSLRMLFKPFSSIEIRSTRAPSEMLVRLSPLGRHKIFCDLAFLLDKATHKLTSKQTSGYVVFLTK